MAEWRDTNDIRFRDDSSRRDTLFAVQELLTEKCLVLTHYDVAADASHSPVVLDDGASVYVVKRQRQQLVRSTRRSRVRAVFVKNVSTILEISGYTLRDDVSNALVHREEVLLPDHVYSNMLLDRGRLWMAEVRMYVRAMHFIPDAHREYGLGAHDIVVARIRFTVIA